VTLSPPKVFGLLLLLVGLAYWPTLDNDFTYDDRILIEHNERLQRLDGIPRLFVSEWWAGLEQRLGGVPVEEGASPTIDRRYRPLAAVSYVLNYKLGGGHPFGYHLVNLLLHAAGSWLLYLVALEVGLSVGAALLAAIVFAVHPLHSEAVAWGVGRPELMMALGVLAGLWCAGRGYRNWALAAFACGLLSKEQAVVLPALVILYDFCMGRECPPDRTWRGWLWFVSARYGGYALVLSGYLFARLAILGDLRPPRYGFLANPLEHIAGAEWALSTLKLAGRYLWLTVWPVPLVVDYSYNAIPLAESVLDPGVLWAAGTWGGLLGLAVWGLRRDRRVSFAVGLTVLSFAPVANVLVPVGTPMAERLFYLPLGGLCLLAGLAYDGVRCRVSGLSAHSSAFSLQPSALFVLRSLLIVVCLALTLRTVVRTWDWANNETLFRSAVRVVPDNAKAHYLLGLALLEKKTQDGRERALAEFQTAIALYPDYPSDNAGFNINLGAVLFELGRAEEALKILKRAMEVSPRWSDTHRSLGLVYAKLGRHDEAERTWREGLALTPEDPDLRSMLSRLLLEQGRYGEALAEAEVALKQSPDVLPAFYTRTLALEALGRMDEAAAGYERVLALASAPPEARQDAGRRLRALREKASHQCQPGLAGC
jgi:Flp pilus assembly protein TadD